MEYLKQIIILPLDLEWYDARSNANFLNAVDQLWHPFDLKGTTDVVILNKAQLLVANHYSNNNVLSLLNDLNNYWEFFWEYDTEICFYRPASEEPAIKMLHDYVYAESNSINVSLGSEFNVDENDYPLSKRRKSKSYN
ncbi:14415_t:CDS:2 [Entrophospora sp. SA101]|nr:24116_t:CDS:2 [Entrophospora sp. SA101]CAJ0768171.1 14415_t:CDS:2 [Entrophospora sp. SA101]CAJ0832109.1 6112_t:CDS:2 [Entrophospora sp. SA101]